MKERNKIKQNSLLGKEFNGLKGKEAIDKLLEEKQGYVKGAFTREDIGEIDLIWGDSQKGLQHIIESRIKRSQDLKSVLKSLPKTIENGMLSKVRRNREKLKLTIEHKNQRVVIGTELNGESFQFVLTSYEMDNLKKQR